MKSIYKQPAAITGYTLSGLGFLLMLLPKKYSYPDGIKILNINWPYRKVYCQITLDSQTTWSTVEPIKEWEVRFKLRGHGLRALLSYYRGKTYIGFVNAQQGFVKGFCIDFMYQTITPLKGFVGSSDFFKPHIIQQEEPWKIFWQIDKLSNDTNDKK